MVTVYNCIAYEHDLRLVILAAFVCTLASFTALNLLHHVRKFAGVSRAIWLSIAALSIGFGIWATHFIAMLAYSPALPVGYDTGLTIVSLVAAIVLTGTGMWIALLPGLGGAAWGGGLVVGAGIAAMHYIGMAAFEVSGAMIWDRPMIAASVVLGAAFGAMALPAGLQGSTLRWKLIGTLLLVLAICTLHFTAMGAVELRPDSMTQLSPSAVPTHWLAAGVAFVSIAILLLCCVGLSLDLRERRRSAEIARIRDFADAAIEGLILCDGEVIVSANRSFSKLVGQRLENMCGQSFAEFIPEQDVRVKLLARAGQSIEAELRCQDGGLIPVELISGTIMYSGHLHHVVALRDLRERKEAEAQIHFLAHHDPLTRLANRARFSHELDHEIELHRMSGRQLAVLYLDLDRFKEVNDLYGHAAGDQLLQDVAKRLSSVLNEHQLLARLGGDEFAIIVPGINGPTQAERLAERILGSFASNDAVEGLISLISVSIGIAMYPSDAEDRATLLSHADTALYRSKVEGKGTFRFFEPAMGDEARERRALEHDLRHAIVRGEFSLVYQPQAQIGTGEVTGFEALLRWNHPRRGDVPPAVFIPLAEESGLILSIGEWVLREACLEAASWTRPLSLAVNVSAVQLGSTGFAELVQATLEASKLSPERLEIEVTETALIRDPARAHQALKGLAALGVQIAIDDFGTGYSSLSNLRAFPFSKIKIDGSFIQAVDTNPQAATIVRAVLGLGHGLGLPIVAEGVETLDELHFLEAEGCTQAQGYLLAHPAPIHTFRSLTCSNVAPIADLITRVLAMEKQKSHS